LRGIVARMGWSLESKGKECVDGKSSSRRRAMSFFIGRRLPNLPRRHGGTETRRKLGGKTKSKAKAKPRTCQNLNRREEPESSLFLRGCLRAYAQRLNGRR